jgi:hypothetical protein
MITRPGRGQGGTMNQPHDQPPEHERATEIQQPGTGVQYYPGRHPYQGMSLHTGHNGWGSPQNKTITEKIAADSEWLAGRGVELAQWGPDPVSGKVKVYLTHYTDAARQVLVDRYGDAIVVDPKSRPRLVAYGARRINT